jgi:hypothetical protein
VRSESIAPRGLARVVWSVAPLAVPSVPARVVWSVAARVVQSVAGPAALSVPEMLDGGAALRAGGARMPPIDPAAPDGHGLLQSEASVEDSGVNRRPRHGEPTNHAYPMASMSLPWTGPCGRSCARCPSRMPKWSPDTC